MLGGLQLTFANRGLFAAAEEIFDALDCTGGGVGCARSYLANGVGDGAYDPAEDIGDDLARELVGCDPSFLSAEVGQGDRGHRQGSGGGTDAERNLGVLEAETFHFELDGLTRFGRGRRLGWFVGGAATSRFLDVFEQVLDVAVYDVCFIDELGAINKDLFHDDVVAENR